MRAEESMSVWRSALAAGLGCGIVSVVVAAAAAPALLTAVPTTAAVLLVTVALTHRRKTAPVPTGGPSSPWTLLEERVVEAARSGDPVGLLSIRVDGLDRVSDTLGPTARDTLVDEATARIADCLRPDDTMVVTGLGELALLLPRCEEGQALVVAEQVRLRLKEPMLVAGVPVVTSVSIGLTTGVAHLATAELDALVHAADLAMHQAARDGGDRVRVYSRQLLHDARQGLSIETDLRESVANGGLSVHFMPIVEAHSGQVRSVEALVRWEHPTLGLLAPPQFLGTAERAGLMVEVGRQVRELACTQLVAWRRQWPDLAVAVNVSEQELLQPEFAREVLATLRRHDLPAAALHLEVTETVAVGEDAITAALEPLARAGVACSLDDFGTGHSSLHRLRRLPVQRLKIDKSFVAELDDEQGAGPLLASIISMAHGVGHTVVAEGVETRDQADFLALHGCDELQGYLFSRPVPADEVSSLLTAIPASAAGAAGAAGVADATGVASRHPAGRR
jgi:diguanylate cyclase (GGDEF)-like protein